MNSFLLQIVQFYPERLMFLFTGARHICEDFKLRAIERIFGNHFHFPNLPDSTNALFMLFHSLSPSGQHFKLCSCTSRLIYYRFDAMLRQFLEDGIYALRRVG